MKTASFILIVLISDINAFIDLDANADQSGVCSLGVLGQLSCLTSLGTETAKCQGVSVKTLCIKLP